MADCAVYIVASKSRVLYIGVTNDLKQRVWQHREKVLGEFSARYHTSRLVWYEQTPNIRAAIEREKQLKGWKRERKIALIEASNPEWKDLADSWASA